MAETALAALFRAIQKRAEEGASPWSGRAFLSPAQRDTPYPYLVYQKQAGGEINQRKSRDAEFVMVIKVIDDSLAGALGASAVISDRFNDAGVFDSPDPLDGGADWVIQTTTEEQNVFYTERIDGPLVYHAGAQFRVRMGSVS